MGKEEIARNEQFLLFPQCFQLNQITVSPFVHIFHTISLFAVELEEPKIGISGQRLTISLWLSTLPFRFEIKRLGGLIPTVVSSFFELF